MLQILWFDSTVLENEQVDNDDYDWNYTFLYDMLIDMNYHS